MNSDTFHLTPFSKVVLGLLWAVLASLLGVLLGVVLKVLDKQTDFYGVMSGALVEIRQQRSDVERVEREQQRLHEHVVSVDTYAHDNINRLDRRMDEYERGKKR